MSGRRWGIGLVTVVLAVVMAISTLMAFIVVIYEICDTGQSASGSTANMLCNETAGTVAFIAYLFVPTLSVVVGGIAGIAKQRWSLLWVGLAIGFAVLVIAGVTMGNVDTGL